MYKHHTVAVVVPAYNEVGLVGRVIETMPQLVDRVYVVDDGSADGTWAEIERVGGAVARDRPAGESLADGKGFVVSRRHEENQGRGRCIKEGYRLALADGADVVAVMDGDGQMDPAELPRILDPIVEGRADYSKGTRLHDRSHVGSMTQWRLLGNLMLSFLTNISSGYWGLLDSQNGYTAISRHALEQIRIGSLYDGYGFLNDLLTELNVQSVTIAEVPHPAVYADEESGIRYRSFVPAVSALLLRNFLYRLQVGYLERPYHPTALCYGAGLLGFLGAVVGGVGTLVGALFLTPPASPTLLAIGSLFTFTLGVLLDVNQNASLTYQSDPPPESS